ncbi:MAG: bifunctional demethylmenaquinone methyltransferase/2-methoxy-6-polyprenyl,4-benzoquinol methylase [Gammaproteobacteria bacterium]|jgi:demethylmenaquinone methyltransferase/2-methoxy-6-polyprenyl-1,4-benzoquinol methylase|nr:bifunctional demethylmenaquinone methyltransferase/2-methoxy-6-polyprenyl,4-benzoquinol methylase [Gammaproteobacteria bacterium]
MKDQDKPHTTHFGFKEVPWAEKQKKVAEVFSSVANKYDVMNDVMSFGIHRLWKRYTISMSKVRPGQKVLDLAGGTGDLAMKFAELVGKDGLVVLADINSEMLNEGRKRLEDKGYVSQIKYSQVNAESLPFPNNYFDCITIAFGLRNVTDKDQALREMYRVLKPGGQALILEFSHPILPIKPFYDTYSFHILPKMGKLIAQDEESYRYLAESIRKHPDQDTLKDMMKNAGFDEADYTNLTGGIVALHKGLKY